MKEMGRRTLEEVALMKGSAMIPRAAPTWQRGKGTRIKPAR